MNFPPANLSSFHSDILQQTQLGQLRGQNQLFRDRYEILRMLGRGGFGVTFLVKDFNLPGEPLCVIKQLCPKFNEPKGLETAQRRFEKEAKTLSKLGSHSQIPMLLDYFVVEGEFYLVQEYVRGYTLARLVRRYGPQSEEWVRAFLLHLLPLIQYIHRHQVIHRDIKPQNIIRCQDDGRLVLIDFGAVKEEMTPRTESVGKTASTNFVGTIGFAPPEQFSLRPVFASDIYALGMTCLYLLTGKAPLEFENERRTGEILWRDRVEVSDEFAQILDKMLKISVRDRYQSVGPILLALQGKSATEHLSQYMAVQPDPREKMEEQPQKPTEYVSPTARTAIALKEWRARWQAKHPHSTRFQGVLSSTGGR